MQIKLATQIDIIANGRVAWGIGAGWADQPIVALAVSYVLPILLLPIALYPMRRRAH